MSFYTFKTETKEMTILGVKETVKIEYSEDYDDIDVADTFDFGDEKENADYLARFKSGNDLVSLVIQVKITTEKGITGRDVLGGCHVKAGSESDIMQTITDNGMLDNAKDDLESSIINGIARGKRLAERYNG